MDPVRFGPIQGFNEIFRQTDSIYFGSISTSYGLQFRHREYMMKKVYKSICYNNNCDCLENQDNIDDFMAERSAHQINSTLYLKETVEIIFRNTEGLHFNL